MALTIRIECTVATGRGTSSKDQDVVDAVSRLCGFTAYPGSLNLLARKPVRLGSNPPSLQEPTVSNSILVPATLSGEPVVIRRWRASPLHTFEVYAPMKLRAALGLKDGDRAVLQIPRACVVDLSLRDRFFWALFWRFREKMVYSSYIIFIRKYLRGKRLGTQKYTCNPPAE